MSFNELSRIAGILAYYLDLFIENGLFVTSFFASFLLW